MTNKNLSKGRKVTPLDLKIKNKVVDTETKKIIQYISLSINLSKGMKYKCWWCTFTIDETSGQLLGCPINVTREGNKKIYSTDGVFCSFNCVKAYILQKEQFDVLYENSHILLGHMFCDMNGFITPITIEPAPDKKLLLDYGGYMTKEQYYECFNRLLYTEKGIINMYPVTTIFEEDEKINTS